MNAVLIEFNDSGKTLSKKKLSIGYASSNKPPLIYIELPDRQFRHRTINISVKELIALVINRHIDGKI